MIQPVEIFQKEIIHGNNSSVPQPANVLFALSTGKRETNGVIDTWNAYAPGGSSAYGIQSPTAELLNEVKWTKNLYRSVLRPSGLLVLLVVLLLYSGLARAYGGGNTVLARIGHIPITQSEFEGYVRSGLANASMKEIRTNAFEHRAALEAFFDLKVMAAKARQDGIDRELTFQKASQLMEMKLLAKAITDRDRAKLMKDSSDTNKLSYMDAIKAEVGLKTTDLATNDSPLAFTRRIKANAVLATLGGTKIRESDFRWFLKDAFPPEQRLYVFEQPGARRRLLHSYLDMRALAAKARKDGLDRRAVFKDRRSVMEDKLLAEFLQERDHKMPWELLGSDSERIKAMDNYFAQLRSEVRFKVTPSSPASNVLHKASSMPRSGDSEGGRR